MILDGLNHGGGVIHGRGVTITILDDNGVIARKSGFFWLIGQSLNCIYVGSPIIDTSVIINFGIWGLKPFVRNTTCIIFACSMAFGAKEKKTQ